MEPQNKKVSRMGLWLTIIGIILALSPLVVAFVSDLIGGNSGNILVIIGYGLFAIPAGIFISVLGLIIIVIKAIKDKKTHLLTQETVTTIAGNQGNS